MKLAEALEAHGNAENKQSRAYVVRYRWANANASVTGTSYAVYRLTRDGDMVYLRTVTDASTIDHASANNWK